MVESLAPLVRMDQLPHGTDHTAGNERPRLTPCEDQTLAWFVVGARNPVPAPPRDGGNARRMLVAVCRMWLLCAHLIICQASMESTKREWSAQGGRRWIARTMFRKGAREVFSAHFLPFPWLQTLDIM